MSDEGFTDQLVGVVGAAAMFGVQRKTVRTWIRRGVAPEPMLHVDGEPFWSRVQLKVWAETTGRELA